MEILSEVLLEILVFWDVITCRWAFTDVSKDPSTNFMCIGPYIILITEELDATYYFIMLMLGSTCFGHHYAHHQELTTIALYQPSVRTLIHPACT